MNDFLDQCPLNLNHFCSVFRPTKQLYNVIILTSAEYNLFHYDIKANQALFERYRKYFSPIAPTPAKAYFYTYGKYQFIECKLRGGYWHGRRLENMYQVFSPRYKTPAGPYQIFHGCPPSPVATLTRAALGSC